MMNHNNFFISDRAVLRIDDGGILEIGDGAKIDDDVRIVVSSTGRCVIGKNSKIGKGTIINCGGTLHVGNDVAVYGYCVIQTSTWTIHEGRRVYNHGEIILDDHCVISPFCFIGAGSCVQSGEVLGPHSTRGVWL